MGRVLATPMDWIFGSYRGVLDGCPSFPTHVREPVDVDWRRVYVRATRAVRSDYGWYTRTYATYIWTVEISGVLLEGSSWIASPCGVEASAILSASFQTRAPSR